MTQAPHLKNDATKGLNSRIHVTEYTDDPIVEEDHDTQDVPAFPSAKRSRKSSVTAEQVARLCRRGTPVTLTRAPCNVCNVCNVTAEQERVARRKSIKTGKKVELPEVPAINEEVTRETIHKREKDMLHKLEMEQKKKDAKARRPSRERMIRGVLAMHRAHRTALVPRTVFAMNHCTPPTHPASLPCVDSRATLATRSPPRWRRRRRRRQAKMRLPRCRREWGEETPSVGRCVSDCCSTFPGGPNRCSQGPRLLFVVVLMTMNLGHSMLCSV